MPCYEAIRLQQAGPVGVVTLNRPQVLNALNTTLLGELYSTIRMLDDDDDTAVIVITGAGDRAFSAGTDIDEMARLAEEGRPPPGDELVDFWWRLANTRKPTIGALNGLCYGAGALMASSLDMRIGCARTCFRFLAVKYGRLNSTWTLSTLLGMPVAKDLLLTARVLEAEEALRLGLLNRLVAPDQVLPAALEIASTIAANDQRMVRGAKRILNEGIGSSLRERFDSEEDALRGPLLPKPVSEAFKEFLARKVG